MTVLKGSVTWRAVGPGASQAVFPALTIASATVAVNGHYAFALTAGTYVLRGHVTTGNLSPWTTVVVKPGVTTTADIPNQCL